MNILYITQLDGCPHTGTNVCIPQKIEAQSKFDNVFWYNLCNVNKIDEDALVEWKKKPYYHSIQQYPKEEITALPDPFRHPDLIVVEQFYGYAARKIRKSIIDSGIPYIITPHGELTSGAQGQRMWKKKIANLLIFKRFARRAAAVQYLTTKECENSGCMWNTRYLVIPNGIDKKTTQKHFTPQKGIQCISIGRIDLYHKGLDTLVNACKLIQEQLLNANCTIQLFGPGHADQIEMLQKQIKNLGVENIVRIKDGLYGEEKEHALLNSDVFLLPSRFEGHPLALLEALSYGIPCVVTTGSGMCMEVEQENCGWTAEHSVNSIAAALLKMIEEKNLHPEMGKNAKVLADHYSWENIAKLTHKKYQQLLESSSSCL